MDGGRRRSSNSGVVCVGGRMDVATQSGAWAAAAAAAGAPQRRVLFHPALAKGLPSSHHTPSLPRPLNAAMAGCSNPRAAGTSGTSTSSSSHPSLTWTPVSRIVSFSTRRVATLDRNRFFLGCPSEVCRQR